MNRGKIINDLIKVINECQQVHRKLLKTQEYLLNVMFHVKGND